MSLFRILIVFFIITFAWYGPAWAADDLLPPEQAFKLNAAAGDDHSLRLSWDIADGYYLYRKKLAFVAKTSGVSLGEALYPVGQIKHDDYFGDVEIYRGHLDITLPLKSDAPLPAVISLQVTTQGCADRGICYPPQKQMLDIALPKTNGSSLGDAFKKLGLTTGQTDLLPAEQAFQFFAEVKNAQSIALSWHIADGYYLYREKLQFELLDNPAARLGEINLPHGEPKEDEAFGRVEIFHQQLAVELPILREQPGALTLRLKVRFQGCAERGVCYPPMSRVVTLELPALSVNRSLNGVEANAGFDSAQPAGNAVPSATGNAVPSAAGGSVQPAAVLSEQDRIAAALRGDSWWLIVLSFLGFGLLLAFTPCCFPMIPILSGIIVGHGHHLTTRRAFILSLVYVLASALTYTLFGVLAGLFGANLQSAFQQTWVLVTFALVFVALALSMFGFYELQMPSAIQSRLDLITRQQKSGSALGAAVMGFLSTLIVGPCVAAPLAGALIYIGQTGNALLGGIALFAMGFGAGIPLLVIGASAGKLLPKAGHWMHTTKAVFGVGLLAVAVWLLARVLPSALSMAAWALLLIVPGIFMGALDHLPPEASGWRRLWKGLGLVMLSYGILLLIGVAADSHDPLQPLRVLTPGHVQAANPTQQALPFQKVRSLVELDSHLVEARTQGRPVILDYYADWCISCQEMEHNTFADPRVRQALRNAVLLQADITDNSEDSAALLKRYQLIGPPAMLFFSADGQEQAAYRIVGYMEAERFLQHLQQVLKKS